MSVRSTSHLAAGAATLACAAAGSLASDPDGLYHRRLDKPSWNPPDAVFPVVWSTFYADIAATSGIVISRLRETGRNSEVPRSAPTSPSTRAGATSSSGPTSPRSPRCGRGALAASSAGLVRRTAKVDRRAGAALTPYVAWTGFATAVSTEVWRRNR
ncbi:TspO/MBR family protein [Mobilicoccus pelagius]|uniref:TspO/MBR family protein n=1 Tax=Mobilicoccus pelagius NBRC 104925 TaxID=1089455 RepID=H5UVI4_9MICO|nr:TspO/MBR family protein [Mobilicoccus pelagius]GAB49742.1 hypothetical protein MOPEL_134_00260 [Mobilicoccus pelagius NBRC 104925]